MHVAVHAFGVRPIVAARIPSRLIHAMLVVLLAVLLAGCKTALHSGMAEHDADELIDVLYADDIAATKSSEDGKTWTVMVDEGRVQRAVRVMRSHGLPRQPYANMGELFKKEGMISSPSEERIRFVYAVSQELARTLSQIDGVVSARVHPVIPFNDPLAEKVKTSSVSVFIKHRRDADLQILGPAIKNLVLRSIEGLNEDSISLTFIPTAAVAPPPVERPEPGWQKVLVGVLAVLLSVSGAAAAYLYLRMRDANRRGDTAEGLDAAPKRGPLGALIDRLLGRRPLPSRSAGDSMPASATTPATPRVRPQG